MDATERAELVCGGLNIIPTPSNVNHIASEIRAAEQAATERAAKIVEGCKGDPDAGIPALGEWNGEWFIPDAEKIAATIREGTPA